MGEASLFHIFTARIASTNGDRKTYRAEGNVMGLISSGRGEFCDEILPGSRMWNERGRNLIGKWFYVGEYLMFLVERFYYKADGFEVISNVSSLEKFMLKSVKRLDYLCNLTSRVVAFLSNNANRKFNCFIII